MERLTESAKMAKNEYYRNYRAKMSDDARKLSNDYLKQWRKKNADKVRSYNAAYWERKALELQTAIILPVTDSVTNRLSVTDNCNSCLQCHCKFNAKRSDSKFCSPACKQKFYRNKQS